MGKKRKELKGRPMVKAAMVAANWRAREFAQLVGLSEQAISGIITGRRQVTKEEMGRFAQALSTPARILFPGETTV